MTHPGTYYDTLRKTLALDGLGIDEGTLYPLLRRLEVQGLLASEWREEDKRSKRVYRLSADGAVVAAPTGGRVAGTHRVVAADRLRDTAMELIERYLHAVRQLLPRGQQDDMIRELGEDLRGQVEARQEALGRALTLEEQGMGAIYLPVLLTGIASLVITDASLVGQPGDVQQSIAVALRIGTVVVLVITVVEIVKSLRKLLRQPGKPVTV